MASFQVANLVTTICREARVFGYVLKDPRLPVVVRLCLILALGYWLCPFDLKPDFAPGGLIDDSIIVPVLVLCAVLVVPKKIFTDSRRLASGATLGFLCFALSTGHAEAKPLTAIPRPPGHIASLSRAVSACSKSAQSADTRAQPCQEVKSLLQKPLQSEHVTSDRAPNRPLSPAALSLTTHCSTDSRPAPRPQVYSRFISGQSLTIVNLTRSNQLQLYGDSDDPSEITEDPFFASFIDEPPCFSAGGSSAFGVSTDTYGRYSMPRCVYQ